MGGKYDTLNLNAVEAATDLLNRTELGKALLDFAKANELGGLVDHSRSLRPGEKPLSAALGLATGIVGQMFEIEEYKARNGGRVQHAACASWQGNDPRNLIPVDPEKARRESYGVRGATNLALMKTLTPQLKAASGPSAPPLVSGAAPLVINHGS